MIIGVLARYVKAHWPVLWLVAVAFSPTCRTLLGIFISQLKLFSSSFFSLQNQEIQLAFKAYCSEGAGFI